MDAGMRVIFIYSVIVWGVFVIGHHIAVNKDKKGEQDGVQNG